MSTYDILFNLSFPINYKSSDFSSGYNFSIFSQRKIRLQNWLILAMTHHSQLSEKLSPKHSHCSIRIRKPRKSQKTIEITGFWIFRFQKFSREKWKERDLRTRITAQTENRKTNYRTRFDRAGSQIPGQEMNDDIEPVGSNPPSNNEKKSFLLEYEGPTQLYRILHHR